MLKNGSRFFAAMLSLFFAGASWSAALDVARGQVVVESADSRYFLSAPGTEVGAGNRIIVPDGAEASLRYDDCTQQLTSDTIYVVDSASCESSSSEAAPMLLAAATTSDTAAMTGFVWNDVDDDRVRDPDEPPLAGVRIALVSSSCQLGVDCPVATSDTNGNFGFTALAPGTYTVGTIDEDDDDKFVVIAVVDLEAGTTTAVSIALTSRGFVLADTTTTALAEGGATAGAEGAASGAAAAGGGVAATTAVTTSAVLVPAVAAAVVATAAVVDSDDSDEPISR